MDRIRTLGDERSEPSSGSNPVPRIFDTHKLRSDKIGYPIRTPGELARTGSGPLGKFSRLNTDSGV
jgi:hypothetical protein